MGVPSGDEPSLRSWASGEREWEWGGKVQRVVNGEAREFKDWEALVEVLRAMLSTTPPKSHADAMDLMQPRPHQGLDKKGE